MACDSDPFICQETVALIWFDELHATLAAAVIFAVRVDRRQLELPVALPQLTRHRAVNDN
jgi:hypothetical protein